MDYGHGDFGLDGGSCGPSLSFLIDFGTSCQFRVTFLCATPSIVVAPSTYACIVLLYTIDDAGSVGMLRFVSIGRGVDCLLVVAILHTVLAHFILRRVEIAPYVPHA